jgi:hypothetical protein
MRLIIALAVVAWGLIVIATALSLKTIAATPIQTKTEARANSAPIYGSARVTSPNSMKALPAELLSLP